MVAYTIDEGNYSTHVEYKKVCMNDEIVIFFKVFRIIVAVADLSFRMASLHLQTYPTSKRLAYRPTYYCGVLPRYLAFPPV